jgi:predicted subunit of tRNA(5-methylaminomethyl-2-thiouridylate) methyltransferase
MAAIGILMMNYAPAQSTALSGMVMDTIVVKLVMHTAAHGIQNVHHLAQNHAAIGIMTHQVAGQLAAHLVSLAVELQLNAVHESKRIVHGAARRLSIAQEV